MSLFSVRFRSSDFVRLAAAGLALFSLSGFRSFEANFAPDADLWSRWEAHNPQSTEVIDVSAWNEILATYVKPDSNGLNRFAYGSVSDADRQTLKKFISEQTALPISDFSRIAQKAYWINLYNAVTVDVVLDAYPVESIRDIDISPGLFADGPWDKDLVTVEGEDLTLNDIEHRILRPIWKDARIHYAVNCASVGCPNLQSEGFTASNVEDLLDAGARAYVNSPRGVSISQGRVTISSIYDWFFEDFGTSEEEVLAHLLEYADEELAGELRSIGELHDTAYDWSLNDVL
ncbi:MAG: DUF547 domain-containing protein [Rhodobiaceae bacterium]|mgnify:CR=1 FL=1|nr:hypothetical protein RHODOSMS8_01304 [Rhodobiaceae bacterium]MCR9241112.1 DUF547 domain-containing protein [Rhodobiaceae bacterium]